MYCVVVDILVFCDIFVTPGIDKDISSWHASHASSFMISRPVMDIFVFVDIFVELDISEEMVSSHFDSAVLLLVIVDV